MWMGTSRERLSVAFVLAAATACGAQRPAQGRAPLRPCRLDGLPEEVRCGTLEVPEDRKAPERRTIELRFAVVPALSATPAPDPLFILAGGPGQAATAYAPWALSVFRGVRRERDLVLLDQRGSGASHPLDCPELAEEADSLGAASMERVAACRARLQADPSQYANDPAMEDLDAVRATLGYERINLWGGSYGTRSALVYLRKYPRRVRAAVLDGVVAFDWRFPLEIARDGQRALDLLFEDCARDADCRAAFPDPRATLARLLRDLERSPARVALRDPRTGTSRRVTISRDGFALTLRGFLYSPLYASLVPFVLDRAASGDFEPFVALHLAVAGWSVETMSLGMTLSVLCSEDVAALETADVAGATRGTFLGTAAVDQWRGLCAEWPRARLPPGFAEPAASDVPTLLLSGGLDPATPPRWGERMAAQLSRSRHVVAPGLGHNVSPFGCAPELIAAFLRRGSLDGLDGACLDRLRRPPFVVSPAGPGA